MREQAARCLAALTSRFPQPQLSLSTRVSSVCVSTLLDTSKALTSHYGAICGLAAMGPRATRLLLLPHLGNYYGRLVPVLRQVCSTVYMVQAFPAFQWRASSPSHTHLHWLISR